MFLTLGPDATGLGQIFWYTLEGRTPEGEPAGGRMITMTVDDFRRETTLL